MSIQIKTIQSTDAPAWDTYVDNHPQSSLYHLSGWKNVIEKSYGHRAYYLMAIESDTEKLESLPQACPVKPESCFTGAQRSSSLPRLPC